MLSYFARLFRVLCLCALATITLGALCDKGQTAPATPPVMTMNGGSGQSAAVGSAVATAPSVKVASADGQGVAGISIVFAIASGGGSMTGATQTTNSAGIAALGGWTMGPLLGANSVTATATGATGGPITFTATAVAGAAKNIAVSVGNNQTVIVGGAVAVPPAVLVTDAGGNPVTGTAVTFAIASGGGTIVGGSATTGSNGIATIGSWTPGTIGANTLTATANGLTGSPVTFTATGTAGPAAKLTVKTAASSSATNRVAFATQPAFQVADANGNAVSQAGTVVSAAITSGGGTLGGTATATTNASGVATFTNLSISGIAGARTLTFSAPALTAATAQVTTTAGAATIIAVDANNNQTAVAGSALATSPSVKATDADANGVQGVSVTFAVASGGGSVTGPTQTTDASGIAKPTIWVLGAAAGTNTMTATSTGLTGSPLTLTATGTVSNVTLTSVSPAILTPGATAIITGTGFSTTPIANNVVIDGVNATTTAATATQLTVTVPSTYACAATHDATIGVTVVGNPVKTITKPLQIATLRTLAVGEAVMVTNANEIRCNELANTGGRYLINLYNVNTTYSTTALSFEIDGALATGSASTAAPAARIARGPTTAPSRAAQESDALKRAALARTFAPADPGMAAHDRIMRESARIYAAQRGRASRTPATRSVATAAPVVGDAMAVRIFDVNSTGGTCNNYIDVTGRVAYVGTKSIIVEDNANPVKNIDSTYAAIGQEFDNTMYGVLTTSFGDPLLRDALTDNNQRIVMVFSKTVNSFTGLAGFVIGCDLFARSASDLASNFGEYFYATAPTTTGNINTTGSPPQWRWGMRSTIIHESKHIVSQATHLNNNTPAFEESWLEESTARIAEELYERSRYTFAQKANIGYGSAASSVGPYCGVRACLFNGSNQPSGIVRVFQELAFQGASAGVNAGWFVAMEDHSPLGRLTSADFSFYSTAWSLVRWSIDHGTLTESAFLKALISEPSKTGIANLEARAGRLFPDMVPAWTFANALDDYPGLTLAATSSTIKQPSWNFRDIFIGLKSDFSSSYAGTWPLLVNGRTFGAWGVASHALSGTDAFIELSGTQTAKQLIELKAAGSSTADAPSGIRIAIFRIQ